MKAWFVGSPPLGQACACTGCSQVDASPKQQDGKGVWRSTGCIVPLSWRKDVADTIADVLAADNPRFDHARFIEACETGKCKGMA